MDGFKGQSTRRHTDTSGHDSSAAAALIDSERRASAPTSTLTQGDDLWMQDLLRPGSLPQQLSQRRSVCSWIPETKQTLRRI